jgi:Tfp pilus assembly protein PilO
MRKRDIWILVGLGVVVLIVAWYFLLLKPTQDELSTTQNQLETAKTKLADSKKKIDRLGDEQTASRQTTSDLLKLNKLVPADSQIPSLIMELQETANDVGVKFMTIKPDVAFAGTDGTTVIPIEVKFEGTFLDLEEFMYRVENYARMEGSDVTVSGRLVSAVTLKMGEPDVSGEKLPTLENPNGQVMVTLTLNAYMTGPPPASATAPASASSSSSANSASSGAGATGTP